MYIISISLSLIFLYFHEKISDLINIFDKPDKFRKFHKSTVPITGGLLIYINLVGIFFFSTFFFEESKVPEDLNFFYIFSTLIFLLGILDDKYTLSSNLKFLLSIIIITSFLIIDQSFLINKIQFSLLSFTIFLNIYSSIFLTLLCYLLFLNALNMFDGINLQCSLYCVSLLMFFLINNFYMVIVFSLLIALITFMSLNYKDKSFLGDGGTYLLGFILGSLFIRLYNDADIKVDTFVLLMILPGIDMLRLFIYRLIKKRHPFSADRNHLHHLLLKKYDYKKTILIISLVGITNIVIAIIFKYSIFFILIFIFLYIYSIKNLLINK